MSQQVDDLLCQSIAEVLVVGIAAHVGEGKHGDGRLLVGRLGHGLLQCGGYFAHRLKPLRCAFREAAPYNPLREGRRFQRPRLIAQDGAQDVGRGVSAEGRFAREHLVEHSAEAEDVRALIERTPCACSGDMYAAVPSTAPSIVRVTSPSARHQLREAEVEQLDGRRV